MGEPQQNEPKANDQHDVRERRHAQGDPRSGGQNTPTQDDSRSGKLLLGAVTIGQAPRTDVTADIAPLLGPNVRVIEAGALDGVSDVSPLAPQGGESALASRLADGTGVIVSEAKVMPLVQQAIDRVVARGAFAVVLLYNMKLLPGAALYRLLRAGKGAAVVEPACRKNCKALRFILLRCCF